jgi:hypothetical protein
MPPDVEGGGVEVDGDEVDGDEVGVVVDGVLVLPPFPPPHAAATTANTATTSRSLTPFMIRLTKRPFILDMDHTLLSTTWIRPSNEPQADCPAWRAPARVCRVCAEVEDANIELRRGQRHRIMGNLADHARWDEHLATRHLRQQSADRRILLPQAHDHILHPAKAPTRTITQLPTQINGRCRIGKTAGPLTTERYLLVPSIESHSCLPDFE